MKAAVFMSTVGVMDRVDIDTGTFGKALGGGSGGFTAGARKSLIFFASVQGPIFSQIPLPLLFVRHH